ncbi:DUF2842 domain-containing protein [Sphingomonas jatrophae]|uniref:DUF2842 domain-containing protein n=1 Tax=Sphingomonas jatrophae TaxID=1166337 RepID=A0A1I6L9S5_9SPHN|nr:DUF2842 domain-containing protein [Sphingomonas jatrophae]SFS00225.1 Protein of unknown function [Sphingomonas jatrophae]
MSPREPGDIPVTEPTWRKPAGAFVLIALIVAWAVLIASLPIGRLPGLLQPIVYVVAGIGWIWLFPFRRLFTWMETGRWG